MSIWTKWMEHTASKGRLRPALVPGGAALFKTIPNNWNGLHMSFIFCNVVPLSIRMLL